MPMPHKSQWIADHERALEDYESGEADKETTVLRLNDLGFDVQEIAEQLKEAKDA